MPQYPNAVSSYPAIKGSLFSGANPSGVTTSAGLAATCVGLILSNPAGNTKNLLIYRVSGAIIVAPSTVTAMGLITGYAAAGIVTHTTPLTPASSTIGGALTPTAKLDSAATLVGAPAWNRFFTQNTAAASLMSFSQDMQGSIVLIPGAYAAIGTTIAGPTSGFQGSFEWSEVAI